MAEHVKLSKLEITVLKSSINEKREYLLMHHIESYDRKLIDENIEVFVDATIDVRKIKQTDKDYEQMVGYIYLWTTNTYLTRVVSDFDIITDKGGVPNLNRVYYEEVYDGFNKAVEKGKTPEPGKQD